MSRWLLLVVSCSGCDQLWGLHHWGAAPDAGADAAMIDGIPSCWPYAPSNYDPCAAEFPTSRGAIEIGASIPLDTSAEQPYGPYGAVLLRYDTLIIDTNATWTIASNRPVIIVADTIIVSGTIAIAQTTIVDVMCDVPSSGPTSQNCSGGGGGGGYGELGGGGGGGACAGHGGGAVNGIATLTPLRGGCPGGNSGVPHGALVGYNLAASASGGRGGGGLELSARTRLDILSTGVIVANGRGGSGGAASLAMTDQNCYDGGGQANTHDCDSGGGGGGTGGSLLLEGLDLTIAGSACAVGGGGGAGGAQTGISGSNGGTPVGCAGGSGGTSAGTPGGAGAGVGAAAVAGSNGAGSYSSGGGGGGSVGRIRLHAGQNVPVTTGATISPTP